MLYRLDDLPAESDFGEGLTKPLFLAAERSFTGAHIYCSADTAVRGEPRRTS